LKKIIFLFFFVVYLFGLEKVSLQLNCMYQFRFGGYIAAKEKGFYKEAGLDVELIPYHNNDIVQDVLDGKVNFGIYDENLVIKKIEGKPIKLVASIFKRSGLVLITQPNIVTLKDLEYKTIYISKKNIHTIKKLFENNGIDFNNINIYPKNDLMAFINRKIDAKTTFFSKDIYYLQRHNIKFNIINPSDYEYLIYQGELFTSKNYANNNPILVDRFRQATIKGWYYALNHKKEIATIIHNKYNNKIPIDALMFEAKKLESIIERYIYPIGYINKESLKIQFREESKYLNKPIDVEKIVNDYVFNFNNPLNLDKNYLLFVELYNYYLKHKVIIITILVFLIIILAFIYFIYRLEKEKKKIEALFNKAPVAYILMEFDTRIVTKVNNYAYKLFGYPKDFPLNIETRAIYVTEDDFYRFKKLTNEYIQKNNTIEGFSIDYKFKRFDNTVFWANVKAVMYSEKDILWIVTDIDDLMKIQEKFYQQIQETQRAMKVKEEFLANMSHEIRTPLNAILGFVDIILDKETDEENKKYLKIISKSGKNLLTIINDILDFSKIENGRLTIENIEFDPKDEFRTIISLFESKARAKNINLNVNCYNLRYRLISDPIRIKQIISNLISNAIKFTPQGKSVYCNILYNDKKEMLYIEVIDEGIGIESDKLQKIFEPFLQADISTTRKYGGTGLGLTISKKLVELLGGDLNIKSEPNKGSAFYFKIPAKKAMTMKTKIKEEKVRYNFDGIKLLIVEDNEANQMFLKVLLNSIHIFDIDIAKDGIEAIEKVKNSIYDIILMDENMPNMNGLEASKQIKQMGIKTPIIAVTANALSGDKEKFLKVMDGYLPKPIEKEKLIYILEKFLKE